jgi:hypothetical protein
MVNDIPWLPCGIILAFAFHVCEYPARLLVQFTTID